MIQHKSKLTLVKGGNQTPPSQPRDFAMEATSVIAAKIVATQAHGFQAIRSTAYKSYFDMIKTRLSQQYSDEEAIENIMMGRDRIEDRDKHLYFWLIAHALHDVLWQATVPGYYETFHNTALATELSSKHWMYALLDFWTEPTKDPKVRYMWADCTKGDLETRVGADFLILVPVDVDCFTVMLVQAKRAGEGWADLNRDVTDVASPEYKKYIKEKNRLKSLGEKIDKSLFAKVPKIQQILILRDAEEKLRKKTGAKDANFAFYLFWHDTSKKNEGFILPPSISPLSGVLSARSARNGIDVLACPEINDFAVFMSFGGGSPGGGGATATEAELEDVINNLADEERPPKMIAMSPEGLDWAKMAKLFTKLGYEPPPSQFSPPTTTPTPISSWPISPMAPIPKPSRKMGNG